MHLAIEWLPAQRPAPQLLLLLHDRGGDGATMRPVAEALRGAFAQAAILAPDAPDAPDAADAADGGAHGRQWFAGTDGDGGGAGAGGDLAARVQAAE